MHRVDTSTAAGSLPAPQAAGDPGYFIKGDLTANPPVPPTVPGADWFNMVQEELAAVIEGAGLILDGSKANFGQLFKAIQTLIQAGGRAIKITNATLADGVGNGDAVRWDSDPEEFVKAVADGTANNRAVSLADVTNTEVIYAGETRDGLVSGLTPGGRYHLSGGTAGAMVTTPPDDIVRMGIAKSATQFFLDVDTGEAPGAGGAGETSIHQDGGAYRTHGRSSRSGPSGRSDD